MKNGAQERLASWLRTMKKAGAPKGEIVIVTAPNPNGGKVEFSEEDIEEKLLEYLETMTVKEASAKLAEESGMKKSDLYNLALKLQGKK